MKFNCKCLCHVRLDPVYSLLTAREVAIVWELFKMLDIRNEMALDGKKCGRTIIIVEHSYYRE